LRDGEAGACRTVVKSASLNLATRRRATVDRRGGVVVVRRWYGDALAKRWKTGRSKTWNSSDAAPGSTVERRRRMRRADPRVPNASPNSRELSQACSFRRSRSSRQRADGAAACMRRTSHRFHALRPPNCSPRSRTARTRSDFEIPGLPFFDPPWVGQQKVEYLFGLSGLGSHSHEVAHGFHVHGVPLDRLHEAVHGALTRLLLI
jgi:hypothetical protein